jgi:hypothetical protein
MSNLNKIRITSANVLAANVIILLSLFLPANGFAYQNREHQRAADQAYQILNLMRRGQFLPAKISKELNVSMPAPLTSRPPGVGDGEEARWQRFVQEALAAPDILDNLLADLPDATHPSADCLNAFPQDTSASPQNIVPLGKCRANDLAFAPARGWGAQNSRCYLRKGYYMGDSDVPEFYQSVPNKLTGALLGYWAQNVDEEVDDTHLTWRPTNVLFIGTVKSIAKTAYEAGLESLLLPFACFWDLFSGGNCLDDAKNTSHDYDPVQIVDATADVLDLNVGDWSGNDLEAVGIHASLVGFWHFIRPRTNGDFNRIPGFKLSDAFLQTGTAEWSMDAVDFGALVALDATGISLNLDKSKGIYHYSQYADGPVERHPADWNGSSVAHVEFEPIDNVAQYGWDSSSYGTRYSTNYHVDARYLAWPLHVIMDLLVPHHVAGVLGWGHADWESYADSQWTNIFNEGSILHYYDLQKILAEAYRYWCFLDNKWNKNQTLAVREYMEMIAEETSSEPDSAEGKVFLATNLLSDRDYSGEKEFLRKLLTRGVGAVLAFMIKETKQVDYANAPSDACSCNEGYARLGMNANGKMIHTSACTLCGTGVFIGLASWLDGECVAACPQDKPFAQPMNNNEYIKCVSTCTDGTCSGVSCPSADEPFVENGRCVASCSIDNPVIAYNRICQTQCPDGQLQDSAGFCAPAPATRLCSSSSADAYIDCCRLHGCACAADGDCNSAECSADGICLGATGESCTAATDCASATCQDGVCGQGLRDTPCGSNVDCVSNECVPSTQSGQMGICAYAPGQTCDKASSECGTLGDCSCSACTDPPDCTGQLCLCCHLSGGSCSADWQCCSNYCAPNSMCGTKRWIGEPCQYNADCTSGLCGANGLCQSCGVVNCGCISNSDCVNSATCHTDDKGQTYCLGGTGETCGSSADCISGSCLDSKCGQGAQGAPCVKTSDCLAGVCEGANSNQAGHCGCLGNGSSCQNNSDCCESNCWMGDLTCHPFRPAGEPCTEDLDCQNRMCLLGKCSGGVGAYCSDPSIQCQGNGVICQNAKCCLKIGENTGDPSACCSGYLKNTQCGLPIP